MPDCSIIIPVFNKWELTRNCLQSLKATLQRPSEIIVIDNASTDETALACPSLGKELFGDSFRYVRNDINRNFAGASNQGARLAKGEYLVFLNNDTETQPGWLEQLLEDFKKYPDLAATGPLLVYPDETPLGKLVQHLGVTITSFMKVVHLYQGIPASSLLAKKRRFFQIITAACMVIPKQLFIETGQFDEGFINGFEDVDLCARLWHKGLRMTVNPDSLVIHHESQSPGRDVHEEKNSCRFRDGNLALVAPDRHRFLYNDGFSYHINEWLLVEPLMAAQVTGKLDAELAKATPERLKSLLAIYPFWKKGWERLLWRTKDRYEKRALNFTFLNLFGNPQNSIPICQFAREIGDSLLFHEAMRYIGSCGETPQTMLLNAQLGKQWCADIGLEQIAGAYDSWIKNFPDFCAKTYPRFTADFIKLIRKTNIPLDSSLVTAYGIWKQAIEPARRAGISRSDLNNFTGFPIHMLVYEMEPEQLRTSLNSVLAQKYSEWELYLIADASISPEILNILKKYAARDKRIHLAHATENSTAQKANEALEITEKPWNIVLSPNVSLTPDALSIVASSIMEQPEALFFYPDSDIIDSELNFLRPYFKNRKFDKELLPAQNFAGYFTAFKTDHLREIGGFRNGYPEAEDYDLVLRYLKDIPDTDIVHIPHILYHSQIQAMTSKSISLESRRNAAQDWLDDAYPGAVAITVPGADYLKINYPLPPKRPLVSIIIETTDHSISELEQKIRDTASAWSLDLIFVSGSDKASSHTAASLSQAAASAKGEILGFLGADVLPCSRNWLDEIVANLLRTGVGAAGGKVILQNGNLTNAGYLVDSSGELKPLFSNGCNSRYHDWENLTRSVDAIDANCFFTKKELFLALDGLDSIMGSWAFQDYCLRLKENGYDTVWRPFAVFMSLNSRADQEPPEVFSERWPGKITPFNPNLLIHKDLLGLSVNP